MEQTDKTNEAETIKKFIADLAANQQGIDPEIARVVSENWNKLIDSGYLTKFNKRGDTSDKTNEAEQHQCYADGCFNSKLLDSYHEELFQLREEVKARQREEAKLTDRLRVSEQENKTLKESNAELVLRVNNFINTLEADIDEQHSNCQEFRGDIRATVKLFSMSTKHEGLMNDYKLVPMSDITDEARQIAVLWVENYRPMGYDLPGKHKLASDIMNYARRFHEQQLKDTNVTQLAAYREMREALAITHEAMNFHLLNPTARKAIETALDKYPEL